MGQETTQYEPQVQAIAVHAPNIHVNRVLALLNDLGADAQSLHQSELAAGLSPQMLASWRRCFEVHGLQPHRLESPQVVTASELRDVMCPLEDLVDIAKPEVDRLYARVAALGVIITLNDVGGRTLLLRCPPDRARDVAAAGLHLGSIWTESSQGTNGIGTCIADRRALSVVNNDHFSSRLIDLACTVAPIFHAEGEVAAVFNVTTAGPTSEALHALLRQMAIASATRIENLWFERRHAAGLILRLSRFRDFCDLSFEARVALDGTGRIIGATANARETLVLGTEPLIGHGSISMFGISDAQLPEHDRCIQLSRGDGRSVYLKAHLRSQKPVPAHGARTTAPRVIATRALPSSPDTTDLDAIVGHSAELTHQVRLTRKLVDRRLPVLIEGETGTGKSLLARALHNASVHAAARFVALNCAAIPAELIESELFGYRPGAFTGAAKQGSRGLLMEADGGTLFLDEIGDMPLTLQSRLLHVLSGGEFVPVGSVAAVKVTFSLISATLHDLQARVREGLFREDLFFRLAGARLALPPLRTRRDRAHVIQQVFESELADAGQASVSLAPDVMKLLQQHDWPGNIRELQHVLRYAVTVCEGDEVGFSCLPGHMTAALPEDRAQYQAIERENTERTLEISGWNVSAAAQRLGISRATMHRRIQEFDLKRPAR